MAHHDGRPVVWYDVAPVARARVFGAVSALRSLDSGRAHFLDFWDWAAFPRHAAAVSLQPLECCPLSYTLTLGRHPAPPTGAAWATRPTRRTFCLLRSSPCSPPIPSLLAACGRRMRSGHLLLALPLDTDVPWAAPAAFAPLWVVLCARGTTSVCTFCCSAAFVAATQDMRNKRRDAARQRSTGPLTT